MNEIYEQKIFDTSLVKCQCGNPISDDICAMADFALYRLINEGNADKKGHCCFCSKESVGYCCTCSLIICKDCLHR